MRKTIKLKQIIGHVTGSICIIQKNLLGKYKILYKGEANGFEYWMRNFPVLNVDRNVSLELEIPDNYWVIEVGELPMNAFEKLYHLNGHIG